MAAMAGYTPQQLAAYQQQMAMYQQQQQQQQQPQMQQMQHMQQQAASQGWNQQQMAAYQAQQQAQQGQQQQQPQQQQQQQPQQQQGQQPQQLQQLQQQYQQVQQQMQALQQQMLQQQQMQQQGQNTVAAQQQIQQQYQQLQQYQQQLQSQAQQLQAQQQQSPQQGQPQQQQQQVPQQQAPQQQQQQPEQPQQPPQQQQQPPQQQQHMQQQHHQAPPQQAQPPQAQQALANQAATATVGQEPRIEITGCTHGTVGPIARGTYALSGENHGRPVYSKEQPASGGEAMIYFWDQRDGPTFSGWWLGPKVGGDQVWAYHADTAATAPPVSGWKVPFDGSVDPTFVIGKAGAAPPPPQQQYQGWGQGPQPSQQQAWEESRRLQEQQRQEQQRQQQEEMRKRQEMERQRQQEELAKRQKEQQAAAAVRKVMMAMKVVTEETFQEKQTELMSAFNQEMANLGSQAAAVKVEVEQTIEQGRQRLEHLKEIKRQEQAAQAKAQEVLKELKALVEAAEEGQKAAAEEAKKILEQEDLSAVDLDERNELAEGVEKVVQAAKEKIKACTDMVRESGAVMRVSDNKQAEVTEGEKPLSLSELLARISECSRQVEQSSFSCKSAVEKAKKKVEAKAKMEVIEKMFKKYAKSGVMGKTEIKKYANTEFSFTLTDDAIASILRALVLEKAKGVKIEDFQKLKVFIGIEREQAMDAKRKETRLAREKVVAAAKEVLQGKVDEATKTLEAIIAKVATIEEAEKTLLEGFTGTSDEAFKKCDEIEATSKEYREELEALRKVPQTWTENLEPELKVFCSALSQGLEMKIRAVEGKLNKASYAVTRARAENQKKAITEVIETENVVLSILRFHRMEKALTAEALYAEIHSSEEGAMDYFEFKAFIEKCERPPVPPAAKKEEVKEEENGDVKKEEEGAEAELVPLPSEDDLVKVFRSWTAAAAEGTPEPQAEDHNPPSLSKEDFCVLVKILMKVVAEGTMTETMDIAEGGTIRRLEVGEIVEVLSGPEMEDSAKVQRVHCKALKDGQVGYVSIATNTGTKFLEDGGYFWTVTTEAFLSTALAASMPPPSGGKPPRKLKLGEMVEMRTIPEMDAATKMLRFKCRCKSDGATGYVTLSGPGGVYLKAA